MDLFNLSYKYRDKKVYFASLHLQGKDIMREAIFKFIWKKELAPKNFWDAENEKDFDIVKIDHISFHKDGNILLSFYNPKKQHYHERKLIYPLGRLPDNSYIPLLIFSVNDILNHYQYIGASTIPDIGDNIAELMWDIKEKPFPVGVFVMRNNIDPVIVLSAKFPGVFISEDTAWFPSAINENTGLVIAFSKKIVTPANQYYINPKLLKNNDIKFNKCPIIGMSLAPSDKRINNL